MRVFIFISALLLSFSTQATTIHKSMLPTDIDASNLATDAVGAAEIAANAVGSSEIADNAVGLDEMAGGTDGNLITFDASGDPAYVTTGTSGQVLTSNGAGAAPTFQAAVGITSTSIAQVDLTNGGSNDLTTVTIASGLSGVEEVHLWIKDASHNGANQSWQVRIGDSGGLHTTGYDSKVVRSGGANTSGITDGFQTIVDADADAATVHDAYITLRHLGGNVWQAWSSGQASNAANSNYSLLGDVTLDTELTQIEFTTSAGTATFDGGTVGGAYYSD